MTRTEDRLREAFTDAAETVTPPLTPLTVPIARRRPWFIPLVAAAALTLVLLGAAALVDRGHAPETDPALLAGAPSYFVTIRDGKAQVENHSGRAITLIPGRYQAVATGDHRTFFLASETSKGVYTFYRLVLSLDGTVTQPTRVPGAPLQLEEGAFETEPQSFAANPDGTKLAVVHLGDTNAEAIVINTRTGARHTWSAPTSGWIRMAAWADDRSLAFLWWPDSQVVTDKGTEIALLDTSAPGSDLRTARTLRKGPLAIGRTNDSETNAFTFNPDGRTLTAEVQRPIDSEGGDGSSYIATVSKLTGRPTGGAARLHAEPHSLCDVLEADESGEHFLLLIDGRLARVDKGEFSWVTKAPRSEHDEYQDAAW